MIGTPYRLTGLAALALAGPCVAHHSFAMFDQDRTITLEGTVRQFQWTNPHCFIQLFVPSETGFVEWSLEMNSPGASIREGWKPRSLKAGDVVTVVINPVRHGTFGGRVISVADRNGQLPDRTRITP